MVKINRIYTRTGDDGSTGLVGGSRVSKTCPRVQAYGDIDELNSWLGYTIALLSTESLKLIAEMLTTVQNELFDIGSEMASPPGSDLEKLPLVGTERITQLETWIDQLTSGIPELHSFVLPGGSLPTSSLHVARTIARRAERSALALHQLEPLRVVPLRYLNRLSDLLFACARSSSHQLGIKETLWIPAATRKQS